jgi:C-terminal processing protease CtpA/Prc
MLACLDAGSAASASTGKITSKRTNNTGAADTSTSAGKSLDDYAVTREFCRAVLKKVDELVQKRFYNKAQLNQWNKDLADHRASILASTNIVELDTKMNQLIGTLHASHCQFLTRNDETYFFLQSLFHTARKSASENDPVPPKMDFTGAVTGGVDCRPTQVRYVLDGSPAAAAGVRAGDELIAVDGQPYIGQLSFAGKSGQTVTLKVKRVTEASNNNNNNNNNTTTTTTTTTMLVRSRSSLFHVLLLTQTSMLKPSRKARA